MHRQKNESKQVLILTGSALVKQSKNKCTCGATIPQKPKLPEGIRRIKIQPTFVQRVWKDKLVPQILLKGEWLRKIGFECQGHVLIMEEPGKLVIRLEKSL